MFAAFGAGSLVGAVLGGLFGSLASWMVAYWVGHRSGVGVAAISAVRRSVAAVILLLSASRSATPTW